MFLNFIWTLILIEILYLRVCLVEVQITETPSFPQSEKVVESVGQFIWTEYDKTDLVSFQA